MSRLWRVMRTKYSDAAALRYLTPVRLASLWVDDIILWFRQASTTLADLLTPLLVANPFLAVRASLRRWASDEFENRLTHGWQRRLWRWPVDSFFPALRF